MTIKQVLYIQADHNDADYVTSENTVLESDLETIRKVCKAIKEVPGPYGHNWENDNYRDNRDSPYMMYKEYLTEEEIDIFNEYVPYAEHGIHTIETVELRNIEVVEKFI